MVGFVHTKRRSIVSAVAREVTDPLMVTMNVSTSFVQEIAPQFAVTKLDELQNLQTQVAVAKSADAALILCRGYDAMETFLALREHLSHLPIILAAQTEHAVMVQEFASKYACQFMRTEEIDEESFSTALSEAFKQFA